MNWKQTTETVLQYKIRFITVFFLVFIICYAILFVVDFLPEAPTVVESDTTEVTTEELDHMSDSTDLSELQSVSEQELNVEIIDAIGVPSVKVQELPVSMYIERLDKTIEVLNPESRTIADLDTALLSGVVRHPDSAAPNQDGNVFILGHSSYLPNVFNKNFQAFNGIQNLEWGDVITLETNKNVYTYRVEKVFKAKAADVTVPIADTVNMLTIATCNSFGSSDDRYIVEATLQATTSV
jgi:LPXTG-site transpeptidase (sortase) family protein